MLVWTQQRRATQHALLCMCPRLSGLRLPCRVLCTKPNLPCFLSTATKHLLLAFACDPPLPNQAEILAVALIGMGGYAQHGMHAVQSPLGTWELEGWAARSKRVDTVG